MLHLILCVVLLSDIGWQPPTPGPREGVQQKIWVPGFAASSHPASGSSAQLCAHLSGKKRGTQTSEKCSVARVPWLGHPRTSTGAMCLLMAEENGA